MIQIKNTDLQKGFTLLESVVATAVFAVAMVSIIGVYLSIQRINQVNASLQALQQNGRFVSEFITKIIRNGRIDYDSYSCLIFPDTVCQPYVTNLYLLDQDNINTRIYKPVGQNLILVQTPGGSSRLTGNEVHITNFRAYIWPPRDPYGFLPLDREQPTVTVFFELESNVDPRYIIKMPVQITAATRQYDQ